MYLVDNMVDMGLPDGITWPTEWHRLAAQRILLANPEINTRDKLNNGVVNILNIPEDKIKTIKIDDLSQYGFNISTNIGVSV